MTEDEYLEKLSAALADRYVIESKLGEGGMATVYLARDVKHDRLVAVKVMLPEIAASLGSERFLREIQITAQLSHPNVLALYDSGEADGFLYYVMPYIQGESLADLIDREKQLSIDEAVKIAREVAEALAQAHAYGLVHRDIKPDNVMLQAGHAIVADFGVSRAVSEAGGDRITQTGMSVGTPAYMSPEQAMGNPDIDGRADIYSLGCMLYEMLIGQVPFTGPTAQAVMARHTMDQLTAPSIMRDTIPPELEDIIFCAMAKTPADRFRTAHEMAEALNAFEHGQKPKVRKSTYTRVQTVALRQPAWRRMVPGLVGAVTVVAGVVGWQYFSGGNAGAAATCGEVDCRTVAVLYFEDLSPDGSLEPLAKGLTEGLIDRLGSVGALNVVSRNGVAEYQGSTLPPDSIARALGAGTLVAGSVRSRGDRLLVSASVIDGESGVDARRGSFEVPLENVLAARDSITGEVSRLLRQWLGQEISTRQRRAEAHSGEAWLLVQRAERLLEEARSTRTEGDRDASLDRLRRADSLLQLAGAADPQWSEPLLLRAWTAYEETRVLPRAARAPVISRGLEIVGGIVALEGETAPVLEIRGHLRYAQFISGDAPTSAEARLLLESSRDDLVEATNRDNTLARAFLMLYNVYYQLDDEASALRSAERALEADAFFANANRVVRALTWSFFDNQAFAPARRWCAEGVRRFPREPDFTNCRLFLWASPATASVGPAQVDSAWQLVNLYRDSVLGGQVDRDVLTGEFAIGGILGRAGLRDSAEAVLSRTRAQVTPAIDPEQELLGTEAYMRTHIQDYDGAIDLLKRYVLANPDHGFQETAGTHWMWQELRRESPRWSEVVRGN